MPFFNSVRTGSWGKTSFPYVEASTKVAAINKSISIIGDIFASGEYVATNDKGEIIEDDPLVNLLNSPNELQSGEEFRKMFIRILLSSGFSYILPDHQNTAFLRRLEKGNQELILLNSDFVKFESRYLFGLIRRDLNKTGFNYKFKDNLKSYKYTDIIPFFDLCQHPDNNYLGVSRLESLSEEISNILLCDKGKSNQIQLSGHTIVTPRTRNRAESFDMGLDKPTGNPNNPMQTEKDVIEARLHMGGLAQDKSITVSGTELDAFNLMEGIKDVDFGKWKREEEKSIYTQFNIPREFQQFDEKNSTYENREKAGWEIIENICKPIANNLCKSIAEFYKHPNNIEINYDNSPYYAYANKLNSEKNNEIIDGQLKLMSAGVISAADVTQNLKNYGII